MEHINLKNAKMKILKPFIFPLLLLFAVQVSAQESNQEFDEYVAKYVEAYELPGLAISIVKNDEVAFQKAYGYANQVEKDELETESVFAIASLSKAFTATSIAILVDEGKLDWNDRVKDYIPYFNLSDEYVESQMTIEDLLSHRSGFNTFDGDLLWYGTNYSPEEIIKRFSAYDMTYDFRTTYGYQNIMFIVAGEVVEEVSGMSLGDFIKERIFTPLKMNNSYTSIAEYTEKTNVAMPHTKGVLDELRNYDNSAGAALLSSNVEDLSKWIQLWLNEGITADGNTLLKSQSYHKLLNLHTPIAPSSFDRKNGIELEGYGLGWFLMGYQGNKVAHHGGGLPGFISKIFIVPAQNFGGIVLTNGVTSLPAALMYSSIDYFLGDESETNWAQTYLDFTKRYEIRLAKKKEERYANRNKKLKANIKAEDLIGSYEDVYYGKSEVKKQNGKLVLELTPAKDIFSSEMTHWQQNTYRIKFKDEFLPEGFVTFQANADGEVTNFTIDLPNPDFHFYNLKFERR
jgi:CubicO group peptidase (beta-lactamase class C family)